MLGWRTSAEITGLSVNTLKKVVNQEEVTFRCLQKALLLRTDTNWVSILRSKGYAYTTIDRLLKNL